MTRHGLGPFLYSYTQLFERGFCVLKSNDESDTYDIWGLVQRKLDSEYIEGKPCRLVVCLLRHLVFWVCICAYFLGVHSVRVSIQTFDFLGVHLHIFSCCAVCMDGFYPNVVYYS